MKKQLVFIALLISGLGFAQSINDYKAVIIPLRFDFMKSDNQYRLATLSKFNLNKAGFEAYYATEDKPLGYSDRCDLLNMDVIKGNSFLSTKLYIVFKDCYGKIIFTSDVGFNREKSYETAYTMALNKAFESVTALNYQYSRKALADSVLVQPSVETKVEYKESVAVANTTDSSFLIVLYAQPTANGFQLIDSTPSVVFKIQKTAKADYFMAQKGNTNGVMYKKDNHWVFEYYQGETLMSEKVSVKF